MDAKPKSDKYGSMKAMYLAQDRWDVFAGFLQILVDNIGIPAKQIQDYLADIIVENTDYSGPTDIESLMQASVLSKFNRKANVFARENFIVEYHYNELICYFED